jgi:hypothetical protein
LFYLSVWIFGIAETGIARGSPPGTTTEVLRFGDPFAEIRVVSAWTPEVDQALAQLKDFLSKPPVLTAPRKKEQLLLYLAATTHVVCTTIVVEWQEDGHAYPVQ